MAVEEAKDREWTLTHSGILTADVDAGKVAEPDPEDHRPKAGTKTWRLGEVTTVRYQGKFYYGWSWFREREKKERIG